jgi:hypothetical protein
VKLTPLHERLLADILDLGSPYPLVLTGGYAVQAHGLVERFSRDLDVATENPAPIAADREVEGDAAGDHGKLPSHRDYDFGMCSEVFFQDTDVLMPYNARFDGIEDPDGETNQHMGIGDLRAAAWFEPFLNVQARDPHRGFRR